MEPDIKSLEVAPELGERANAFLMEEYSSLRSEIENHLQDRKKLDGQVLAGIFGIYVWVFTRSADVNVDLVRIALFIPSIVCVLGFLKWLSIMAKMFAAADYVVRIEKLLLDTDHFGWEHFIQRRRSSRPVAGRIEGWVEILFWISTFGTTLAISIYALDKI
ncbi:MAG: hypothetical protein COA78_38230 [Blastopirellula sp.]|nr:MAG: hypothetical protein COA78_38230 [Blastopirellula sp.]